MPLLDRIVRQSVDGDYQALAARRPRGEHRPGTVRPHYVAAAMMAIFGVLLANAAVQTSRNAPEASASRASLIEQVRARSNAVARLQAQILRLRSSNTDLRADLASAQAAQQVQVARIARLGARTGLTAVTGPGLRITVDDAVDGNEDQQVRDSDLAALVDGLWSAGAEAISVNGRRLTTLTAFRNVGPAIHIGITPLVRPYTILAIGNPATLEADLLDTTFGQRWYSLVDSLGFVYETKTSDDLSLPAARTRTLRWVRPLTDIDPNRPADGGEGTVP
jgi:uncharacterized protein YlxW (UPF0749 family)